MVLNQIQTPRRIYYHMTTTNQSFMDMHYYLKATGRENNKFFLVIYDPDLIGVDPRDPKLPPIMKQKILRECIFNYWYFLREVVRIPDEGGSVSGGMRYKLHRGNLAMNFLFILNYNIFLELPRQHGKTVSALCRYLWVFNFGTSNSRIMFINKKHDDSKNNLVTMKRIRESLPSYLRMDEAYGRDGKRIKVPNTVETLQHPTNFNKINTLPGARTKQLANGLGRGCTMPIHYYDEFAFIVYNKIIYGSAMPAFSRASQNARANNAPYGILITTTPGDLTTDEGLFAEEIKNTATPWSEIYYDYTPDQLEELRTANTKSSFFYVKYSYQQLGSGEKYFEDMVIYLNRDWPTIRREVLLEWTKAATNCPFRQEDLDIIRGLCMNEPLNTILFGRAGQYQFKIWGHYNPECPPIVGVDVAGGWQQDSSAITVIDSRTTKVVATFNCNYIPTPDLAELLVTLVSTYMKNAIVNIERNGGFGGTLLQLLVKSKIKNNLYYEIKDRVLQERSDGVKIIRQKQKVKVYGTDSSMSTRNELIELLHQRVNFHKDKFVTLELLSELETMEVKKNGKTEHASNAHDDQVFSYLWALYVWYYGQNIMERFNIMKTEIKTDEDESETMMSLEEQYKDIGIDAVVEEDDDNNIVQEQLKFIESDKSILASEWEAKQYDADQLAFEKLKHTKLGRDAIVNTYHYDPDELEKQYSNGVVDITDDIMNSFYNEDEPYDIYQGNLSRQFKKQNNYR